jgi:antitoxin MazE
MMQDGFPRPDSALRSEAQRNYIVGTLHLEEPLRTRIIQIGNSQGVRIPKPLLEKSGLEGEVELEARAGEIIIRSPDNPRAGWEEAFAQMHAAGDDGLLDGDQLGASSWDEEEWEWE